MKSRSALLTMTAMGGSNPPGPTTVMRCWRGVGSVTATPSAFSAPLRVGLSAERHWAAPTHRTAPRNDPKMTAALSLCALGDSRLPRLHPPQPPVHRRPAHHDECACTESADGGGCEVADGFGLFGHIHVVGRRVGERVRGLSPTRSCTRRPAEGAGVEPARALALPG